MAFTFLHTSDWHIGKPFGRLGERAEVLRHARLSAIERLAAAARTGNARHALVAGDLFDQPGLADRDVRAPIAQMQVHADIAWHVIPGNHDLAVPGGAWERARRDGLPVNVHLHLEARPVEIAPACWLLPAPLAARAMSEDPSAWMDHAATPEGALRIGLAHGSIQGFGSERSASIAIAPDRPRHAGLAYLALGDWHGCREIGPRAAYCGTPEPDGFLDNAPGLALVVTIDGPGATPRIERCEIGRHRWLARTVGTVRSSDLAALEGEIEGLGAQALQALLQVEVAGRITLTEERAVRQRLDRLEGRVLYLERRLGRLQTAPDEADIEQLADGPLREIGRELSLVAADGMLADRGKAARALRHLVDLAGMAVEKGEAA